MFYAQMGDIQRIDDIDAWEGHEELDSNHRPSLPPPYTPTGRGKLVTFNANLWRQLCQAIGDEALVEPDSEIKFRQMMRVRSHTGLSYFGHKLQGGKEHTLLLRCPSDTNLACSPYVFLYFVTQYPLTCANLSPEDNA